MVQLQLGIGTHTNVINNQCSNTCLITLHLLAALPQSCGQLSVKTLAVRVSGRALVLCVCFCVVSRVCTNATPTGWLLIDLIESKPCWIYSMLEYACLYMYIYLSTHANLCTVSSVTTSILRYSRRVHREAAIVVCTYKYIDIDITSTYPVHLHLRVLAQAAAAWSDSIVRWAVVLWCFVNAAYATKDGDDSVSAGFSVDGIFENI